MRSYLIIAVVVLSSVLAGFSQTPQNTAPVKWERYGVSGTTISLLLPKLPIRIDSNDPCSERKLSTYWAYAENAAYMVRVVTKQSGENSFCGVTRKFGKELFEDEMRTFAAVKDIVLGIRDIGEYRQVRTFSTPFHKKYVFDEVSKGRWIELDILSRSDDSEREKSFISSLDLSGKEKGLDIRDGASVTLGDPYDPPSSADSAMASDATKVVAGQGSGQGNGQGDNPAANSAAASPLTPMVITAKPPTRFTDLAREKKVQGKVALRVTFLPNGSVGNISVVEALPYGLTEQCISVARKIVFLPARIKDVNVAVTKQVEYTFKIY